MGNLILNFTGMYEKMNPEWGDVPFLDFTELRGSELYVDEEAEFAITREIEKYGPEGLHLLDNGNYHYVSRLFIKLMEEETDLLYFDNHSDDQPPAFEGLKSCGSWVLDLQNEFADRLGGMVWVDGRGELHEKGSMSSERPLYISIDKDVFSKEFAATNWDQGELTLDRFMEIYQEVTKGRRIAGIDICGGTVPHDGLFNLDEIELNKKIDLKLIGFLEGQKRNG